MIGLDISAYLHNTLFKISAVKFEDRSVVTVTDQTLVCTISGLTQSSPVIWIGPDNNEISISDTNNYVIDQGSFAFGSKASTLTIKTAKLAVLSSGDVFKCKLKSAQYPDHSPDVVKEMTLTILSLGEILILNFCCMSFIYSYLFSLQLVHKRNYTLRWSIESI